jgi:hypothetical protein
LLPKRSGSNFFSERNAGNILHHEEVHPLVCIKIIDGGNVGVIQLGKRQGLFTKAFSRRFVSKRSRRQDLEGDVTVQTFVTRPIDHPHSAGA